MLKTDCKILVSDYVFGYRRSGRTILGMAEEEYVCETLDYGDESGSA